MDHPKIDTAAIAAILAAMEDPWEPEGESMLPLWSELWHIHLLQTDSNYAEKYFDAQEAVLLAELDAELC